MIEDSCYGKEYVDDTGECQEHTCTVREACKKLFNATKGLRYNGSVRRRQEEVLAKEQRREHQKQEAEREQAKLVSLSSTKERKHGYERPRALEYLDEGSIRDEMVDRIEAFLAGSEFTMHRTKNIQSVSAAFKGHLNTVYWFKINTTRKKSILCYIRDDVADILSKRGLECRGLYMYEAQCFPTYLKWVVQLKSMKHVDVFLEALSASSI